MIHPLILEINTRCWLDSLSTRAGEEISFATIPDSELTLWQERGFTHIWLMGVWTTGQAGIKIAQASPHFRSLASAFSEPIDAVLGSSPYAIADYEVSPGLGGVAGLRLFRKKLHHYGLKLLLDFVPNHLALDHPWLQSHPDLFVPSAISRPDAFPVLLGEETRWIAHGRDPHFPCWTDVAQLDYRSAATHAVMQKQLERIADECDGVRCDMAMLVLRDVFARTWAKFPPIGPVTDSEFWHDAIARLNETHPHFIFIAEVYWGLESRLQTLGFDYVYEKVTVDLLLQRKFPELQTHLHWQSPELLSAAVHFLENHDELRVAAQCSLAELRPFLLLLLALPGMRLLYDGQIEGRCLQTPVQFLKWLPEPLAVETMTLYHEFLTIIKNSGVGQGKWHWLTPIGLDAATVSPIMIIQWQTDPWKFDLAVINLSATGRDCRVHLAINELEASDWQWRDQFGNATAVGCGIDLVAEGVSLEMKPYAAQLLHFSVLAP